MKTFISKFAIAAAFALVSAPALAASGQVSLTGDVVQDKVVVDHGASRHVLVKPEKVVPGDKLVFTTHYRNDGKQSVENFVVTNPLPSGVIYSADGASGAVVSVDGGKTWGALETLKVADGKGGERAAQASDVTHVRWTVASIAPGASGAVSYRATVR
ncbi:MAG: DUF11 domain-containing protein [Sphingomonadales bacterium]|nr:DUF11 domain-containing protein [Sphingomonadales bacterium]MDE2569775.1 DUF11 domain-containing protein [Sphingomonadales bacterium]